MGIRLPSSVAVGAKWTAGLLMLVAALGLVSRAVRARAGATVSDLRLVQLTFDGPGIANQFPQVSPDGRYVIFQRCDTPLVNKSVTGKTTYTFKEGANWDIYRMRTDGADRVQLTDTPEVEDEATYSPDGATIAYRTVREDNRSELFLMDADGRNKRPLLAKPTMDLKTPAFSPDGRRLLFYGDREKTLSHVFSVDLSGQSVQQLTTGPYEDKHPQFTPDGTHVIFHSNRKGVTIPVKGETKTWPTMGIFSLDVGTRQIRPLVTDSTDALQDARHPFVSPDGRFIVYHAQTFGPDPSHPGSYKRLVENIYLMTRDGHRRVNLTEHDSRYFKHPSWSADGRGIYCVFADKHGQNVWNVAYIDVSAALQHLM